MPVIIDDNTKQQCVLIIDNELLLGASIERLLSAEARLYVIGVTSPDEATLLGIIKHLQPDIVIMDETYFLSLGLRLLIELLDYPQLRLITLSADNNRVQMYYKEQVCITRVADLVHFIRGSKKWLQNTPTPLNLMN